MYSEIIFLFISESSFIDEDCLDKNTTEAGDKECGAEEKGEGNKRGDHPEVR